MRTQSAGEIRYFQFDRLPQAGLIHGVFARHGGVSDGPYASLNLSVSTGDAGERVRENRRRAFRALARDPESIADLWQVHSADVVAVDRPIGENGHSPQADALVTDSPEVTLCLRFADCVPILAHDPQRRVIGLAHAGWKGTVLKAAAAMVQAMQHRYGSRPEDIWAGIGPSIGPCHYEVGPEVVGQVRSAFPGAGRLLVDTGGPRPHFDLWAANQLALEAAGVPGTQIEVSGLCTVCHGGDFFSHRGQGPRTGRFGALLALG